MMVKSVLVMERTTDEKVGRPACDGVAAGDGKPAKQVK